MPNIMDLMEKTQSDPDIQNLMILQGTLKKDVAERLD